MVDVKTAVLQPHCFFLCLLKQPPETLCHVHPPRVRTPSGLMRSSAEFALHLRFQPFHVALQPLENSRDQPIRLRQKCEKQVFTVHLRVPVP